MADRKRVAIIGSGCAGLGAAWALQSTNHDVHLFEKAERLGGHTNTQTWTHEGRTTNVDTGFIVMNSATYRASFVFAFPSFSPLTKGTSWTDGPQQTSSAF